MSDNYRTAKETFVSGMTGSTVTHINMISLVALSSIALHSALCSRLPASRSINFPTAWLILVFPLLLSMTLFANSPGLLSLLLLFPTGLLLFIPPHEFGTPLPSNQPLTNLRSHTTSNYTNSPSSSGTQSQITPLPALTVYRAHMLLMTILAILAVDFPVFPRALAKCETFGFSLMDLGVGSFVFSQGIVSSIPLLKDPSHLTAPLGPKLFSVVRKMLPIIFLGLVRVVLVKGTEYPEHESEYGVHWNFFFTLALLPILQVLLHPVILRAPVSLVGVLVAVSHQMGLSFMGVQNFVLYAPRTNLVSANKEGIVSLTGYLAIHLLGLSIGTLILPPSPSFFRRMQQVQSHSAGRRRNSDADIENRRNSLTTYRQNDKTATELWSYSMVWWSLLGLTRFVSVGAAGVSRRMANLPYIFWVAAFNTSFILGYLLLDLYFFPSPLSKSVYSPISKLKIPSDSPRLAVPYSEFQPKAGNPPALLEAVNTNGLVLFLLANVVTGLVNLTIPTLYIPDLLAMIVLSGYTFCISAAAWILRGRRPLRL